MQLAATRDLDGYQFASQCDAFGFVFGEIQAALQLSGAIRRAAIASGR